MEKTRQVQHGKQVAAIANQFIQHARYKLTPREQKLILYMATLLKPEHSDFETYLVPVSEIEYILKSDETRKHGSFYERLDQLLDSITDKKITFPTDFAVDGVRLRGHINWVAGAVPKYDEHGRLCVEFGFSPQMKPFLLGLREKFTRFEFLEVAQMKSGFSIRIYQMCKAWYFEHIRHGRNVMSVGIRELKQRLGIGDKYPDFRNFRRKVLDIAREEINEKTSLNIEYDFIKKGRNVTDLRIVINEKTDFDPERLEETIARLPGGRRVVRKALPPAPEAEPGSEMEPGNETESETQANQTSRSKASANAGSKTAARPAAATAARPAADRAFDEATARMNTPLQTRIERLTEAQRRAFNTLTEYGVSMSAALDEVLPIVKGSELVGYEDFFVLFMLAFFEKKTSARTDKDKVRAFMDWAHHRRFEEPNLYAQLVEQVVARKKRLNDLERANRERAKTITAAEFRKLLEVEKAIGKSPEPAFSVQKKTASQASKMSRVGEGDLFSQVKNAPPPPAAPKRVFDFEQFKKDYPDVHKRIRKERQAAFGELKGATNFKQLLENSVEAYCEQWFKANG